MKLKKLKKLLNSLTDEQLEQELFYKSDEYSISGVVGKIEREKTDLYFTGEDDPASLYTIQDLKRQGFNKEEIEEFEIEIPKGSFVINI